MFLCSPEITCQDEDSNQYFEGATWSTGKCIECRCVQGKIQCSRKLILTSFLLFTQTTQNAGETSFTEDCNQLECNVATYMKINNGICRGKCNWKCLQPKGHLLVRPHFVWSRLQETVREISCKSHGVML